MKTTLHLITLNVRQYLEENNIQPVDKILVVGSDLDKDKYPGLNEFVLEDLIANLIIDKFTDISDIVIQAERKAFQAGWEGAIDTYEAGEIRGYMNEDFEKWKEESK